MPEKLPQPTGPAMSILAVPANSFGIAVDGASVTIAFSQPEAQVLPSGSMEGVKKVPSVAVMMSPVLAKDLVKVLSGVLTDYERNVGPIPVLKQAEGA